MVIKHLLTGMILQVGAHLAVLVQDFSINGGDFEFPENGQLGGSNGYS